MRLIRILSNINKWDGTKKIKREDAFICGDAISDLKSQGNKISVWKGENDEDVDDAIVALALGRNKPQKMYILFLEETDLTKIGIDTIIELEDIPGLLDKAILQKHRNLIEIDYWRIGFLAEYMLKRLGNNNQIFTEDDIKKKLEKYKNDGKIDITSKSIKESLKKTMKWVE